MQTRITTDKADRDRDRWKDFSWLMLVFNAGIGMLVIGLIVVGFSRSADLYRDYIPLYDAAMEMRMEAISAYLWFEEMLGGDPNTKIDDILKHLDRAQWYANAMIAGGENTHLKLPSSKIPHLHAEIKSLQDQLRDQRTMLARRFNAMASSGAGSEIDSQYHTKLETFMDQSKTLEMQIKTIMAGNYRYLKYIWMGVSVCCLCLFLAAGGVFYRFERLRRDHYLEMLAMQQQMIRNEKLASLGNMIAGIAHEVNNPNTFISFNVPILIEYIDAMTPIVDAYAENHPDLELANQPYEDFQNDIRVILKNIENGSTRINRIVTNLKAFSRKRDGLKTDRIDLKALIEKIVAMHSSKIANRVASFRVDVSDDLPPLCSDPDIIASITINFLTNATEAADKHNSVVALNVYAENTKTGAVIIEVEDNGCGIEKENMDKIFDPFYSTKSAGGAAGMGLYFCSTFADQLGATITVQSTVGTGSTFRLELRPEKMKSVSARYG